MISVIICSADEKKFLSASRNYSQLLANDIYEIVRIHDAKSLCEGYTRGIKRSNGDILIFSHDDIEILETRFSEKLRAHLRVFDIVGVAGTRRMIHPNWAAAGWPYLAGQVAHPSRSQFGDGWLISVYGVGSDIIGGIQALDGVFIAAHRKVVEHVGWDFDTFDGFHLYDADFSFRAYHSGCKLAVANDFGIIHASAGDRDAAIYNKYAERFATKHKARLIPMLPRLVNVTEVLARSKQEVLEIMRSGLGESYL